jgi:anti-sigma regulatory factor (Ser/Thr protein kinase)
MGPTLRLQVAPDRREMRRLNDTAARFLRDCRASSESIHDVQLVLEEVVSNVLRHAPRTGDALSLAVEVEIAGDEIRVRVEDDAAPFDPTLAPDPPPAPRLEDRRPGGLGLRIVRRTTRHMRYERRGDLNVLEMILPLS